MTAEAFLNFPPSKGIISIPAWIGVANSLISEDFDDLIEEEGEKLVFLHLLQRSLHRLRISFNVIYLYIRRWVDACE